MRASVAAVLRLQSTGLIVVVNGLRCSMACGVFPGQGSNPCLLYWQVFFTTELPGKPYLFLTVWALHCGARASLVAVCGLSRPVACGIFILLPGIPQSLNWEADSHPLDYQRSPCHLSFIHWIFLIHKLDSVYDFV